ncbi:hypothetical protein J6590_055295 [Homalodisca vitripennis]|nr:hypothetical protein J6590_055295 [Homalodisca vitripennis]
MATILRRPGILATSLATIHRRRGDLRISSRRRYFFNTFNPGDATVASCVCHTTSANDATSDAIPASFSHVYIIFAVSASRCFLTFTVAIREMSEFEYILNGSLSSESTEDENIVSDFDIDFPDDQFRSSTPLPDNTGGSDSCRSPSLQTKSTTSVSTVASTSGFRVNPPTQLNYIEQQFTASQPHDLPSPQNTAQRRTRRMVVSAVQWTNDN